MNQKEAQEILDERGPWRIRLNEIDHSIKFENDAGDVITVDMWTVKGYPDCNDDIEFDYTIGMRIK